MFMTLNSLEANPFFDGLEYEISVALENFNNLELDKAARVEHELKLIEHRGMCKERFYALEEISPGIMNGVDVRRITTHPSKTYKTVAIETVNKSSFFSKFSNAGGVANFFITFFDWLVGKLTGHGSLGLAGRLQEAWVKGRRKADKLHDYEASVTDAMVRYKSDLVFTKLINSVAKSFDNHDDRNASEIAAAMIEACSKSQGQSVVPTIALAKTCIANNCNVQDFRQINGRMESFALIKSHPAQTCGLAATRQGLPASLLIGEAVGIDGRIGAVLEDLSKQYIAMSKALARMPMSEDNVENWLKETETQVEKFDTKVQNSGTVRDIVRRWNTDAVFNEQLSKMQVGTIGFWYDTNVPIQGDHVFDPTKYEKIVRAVFEQNRVGALDNFAKSVENSISYLQDAVQVIRAVDQQRMEKLVGSYNNKSSRLRAVIKTFRTDATTLLRIARILESYVNGYVRAYKSVKPFRSTYESAANHIMRTSIKS